MSKNRSKNNFIIVALMIILAITLGYISYNIFSGLNPSGNAIAEGEDLSAYAGSLKKINKTIKIYQTINSYQALDLLKLSTINLPLEIGLIGKQNPFEQPPSPLEELKKLINKL